MIKLPLPRRRRPYYSPSYYRKPKRYGKVSLVWVALSLPIIILALELLTRLFVGISGKEGEWVGISPIDQAYRLKYLTETKKPIEGLSNHSGNLVVTRSSSFGYKLVENQKSQFLQINEQGFRDSAPVPLAKPKNEFRIFILGGSTAFGHGNEKNEDTISHQLESRLQQRVKQQQSAPEKYRPDVFPFFQPSREKLMPLPAKILPKQYRVINAAVPGYASGNSLARFALDVFSYQPDMIVILDGYTDLILPGSQTKADVPKVDEFLGNAQGHFTTYLSQSIHSWLNQTYLVKTLDQVVFRSQTTLAQSNPTIPEVKYLEQYLPNETELEKRVKRYQENHKQLIRLAAVAGIPVVIATQPEITGRPLDKLLPQEKMIHGQLSRTYLEKMPTVYGKFAQANQQLAKAFPKNVKVLNLYNFNQSSSKPMFTDPIHLTKDGNAVLAEKLYYTITSWSKIQIIPENFYLK